MIESVSKKNINPLAIHHLIILLLSCRTRTRTQTHTHYTRKANRTGISTTMIVVCFSRWTTIFPRFCHSAETNIHNHNTAITADLRKALGTPVAPHPRRHNPPCVRFAMFSSLFSTRLARQYLLILLMLLHRTRRRRLLLQRLLNYDYFPMTAAFLRRDVIYFSVLRIESNSNGGSSSMDRL